MMVEVEIDGSSVTSYMSQVNSQGVSEQSGECFSEDFHPGISIKGIPFVISPVLNTPPKPCQKMLM